MILRREGGSSESGHHEEMDGVCVLSGRWEYTCRVIRTTSEEVSYLMVHVGRAGEMV